MSKKNKEIPPLVRLVGAKGLVIYPKMVSDGKGDWVPAEPELLKEVLGLNETQAPEPKSKKD